MEVCGHAQLALGLRVNARFAARVEAAEARDVLRSACTPQMPGGRLALYSKQELRKV